MRSYTRVESWGNSTLITDIDDHDNYYRRCVWPDGTLTGEVRCKIQDMGWKDFRDFKHHSLQFDRFVQTGF